MNGKALFFSIFFVLGFVVPSCYRGDDCNFGPIPNYFNIEGMSLASHEGDAIYDCCYQELKDSSSIGLEQHWISMDFAVSYYFGQNGVPSRGFDFNLTPSALACSPAEQGFLGSQEKIESLVVIALNNIDSTYMAGDTINELLKIYNFSTPVDLNEYLNENISFVKQERLVFKLKKAPMSGELFSAKFILKLENAEEYEAVLPPVEVY